MMHLIDCGTKIAHDSPLRQTRLANGVTLLTLARPYAYSSAVGLWLEHGVRHQGPAQSGYAHVIEHLLLDHGARFAADMAALGGQVNAYTGRELTALCGVVPGAKTARLAEMLSRLVLGLIVTGERFAEQLPVIQQEAATVAADPGEALLEQAVAQVWRGHPIGQPLLGDLKRLAQTNPEDVRRYWDNVRVGRRLLLIAVGKVEHEPLAQVARALGDLPAGRRPALTAPIFRAGITAPAARGRRVRLQLLMPLPAPRPPRYCAALIANQLIAGGPFARLYRALRQQGLVYGLDGGTELYSDCGLWSLQLVCDTGDLERCQALIAERIAALAGDGPSSEELALAKQTLTARLTMAEDDHMSVLQRLAWGYFYRRERLTIEALLGELERTDAAQVREVVSDAWRQRLLLHAEAAAGF